MSNRLRSSQGWLLLQEYNNCYHCHHDVVLSSRPRVGPRETGISTKKSTKKYDIEIRCIVVEDHFFDGACIDGTTY